jgi:hypothetical protein
MVVIILITDDREQYDHGYYFWDMPRRPLADGLATSMIQSYATENT